MDFNQFLVLIGGISISVIGYFLRNAMSELKEVKEISYTNRNKIDLLEKEYMLKIERLNEKVEMLYEVIDRLSRNVEKLSEKIK